MEEEQDQLVLMEVDMVAVHQGVTAAAGEEVVAEELEVMVVPGGKLSRLGLLGRQDRR